jgi:hypothetical protein
LARITVGNYALVNDGGAKSIGIDEDKNLIWRDNNAPVKYGRRSGILAQL